MSDNWHQETYGPPTAAKDVADELLQILSPKFDAIDSKLQCLLCCLLRGTPDRCEERLCRLEALVVCSPSVDDVLGAMLSKAKGERCQPEAEISPAMPAKLVVPPRCDADAHLLPNLANVMSSDTKNAAMQTESPDETDGSSQTCPLATTCDASTFTDKAFHDLVMLHSLSGTWVPLGSNGATTVIESRQPVQVMATGGPIQLCAGDRGYVSFYDADGHACVYFPHVYAQGAPYNLMLDSADFGKVVALADGESLRINGQRPRLRS